MRFRWHSSCLRRWWIESHSLYDPFLVSKSIAYYWDHPLSLIIYIGEWMIFLKDHINEKPASAQQYSRISTWFQGKAGVYVTSSWGREAVNCTFLFSTFDDNYPCPLRIVHTPLSIPHNQPSLTMWNNILLETPPHFHFSKMRICREKVFKRCQLTF